MNKKSFAWIAATGLALVLSGCGTAEDAELSQAPAAEVAPQPMSAAAETAEPTTQAGESTEAQPASVQNEATPVAVSEPKA